MADTTEESERVSVQISSLSTQLIESIEKQSQLEEKLNQAKRTIQGQMSIVDEHERFKMKYNELESKFNAQTLEMKELKDNLVNEKQLRGVAQQTVDELNKEIEDLTASLFDEANKMVATARREGHAIEVKNTKLIEQLREKDSILEILNLQLKNLKKVLQNVEEESTASSAYKVRPPALSNERSESSISLNETPTHNSNRSYEQISGPIFSPNITSVRYDLFLFKEFMKFLAVLPHCETLKETSSNSKLLRRLINDEIQPILRLDNASGLGWIVRRTLMSLMMEGLVVVEPLSGLNENFQYGSPTLKSSGFKPANVSNAKNSHLFNFPSDSPPIAVHDKCSFCSEARDDVIEHARMYVLKTQTRLDDGSLVVTNNFPLCRYCLLKVRQTCEIFAFLRSLKLGTWNLEKVTLTSVVKDESRSATNVSKDGSNSKKEDKMSHRLSVIGGTAKLEPQADAVVDQAGIPTTNIQRAWLQLSKLRSALHWTHIGIWSVDDSIGQKIGPLITTPDEKDEVGDSTSISAEDKNLLLEKVDSEDFILKKGDDEEPAESETFDFESKPISPAASIKDKILSDTKGANEVVLPVAGIEQDILVEREEDSAKEPSPGVSQQGQMSLEQVRSLDHGKNIESGDPEGDDSNNLPADQIPSELSNLTTSRSPTLEKEKDANDNKEVSEANDTISGNEEEVFDDATEGKDLACEST